MHLHTPLNFTRLIMIVLRYLFQYTGYTHDIVDVMEAESLALPPPSELGWRQKGQTSHSKLAPMQFH